MSLVSVRWERRAVDELSAISKIEQRRVVSAVEGLRGNPLKGELLAAEWKGLRRLRVGKYRVIYAFDGRALMISIVRVGHRREVYR